MAVVTTSPKGTVVITSPPRPISVSAPRGAQGPPGPPGASGVWISMTLAEFQALPNKDPDVLYVIVP